MTIAAAVSIAAILTALYFMKPRRCTGDFIAGLINRFGRRLTIIRRRSECLRKRRS